MTPNETIKLMLIALNDGNNDNAYKVAEIYASKLSKSGDSYMSIRGALSKKPLKITMLSELPSSVKNLLNTPDIVDENVYLNNDLSCVINNLLTEWKHADLLRSHCLPIRGKILLHGPTGNGKTTIARHIARLTELPFVEINSDMIIESRIGNSCHNINNVFNSIQERCVLFWDEVDSIGRMRGKGQQAAEVENDRMVNSMLANMEKLNKDVIFIGATNRIEVLDPAFLRRFEEKVFLPEPSIEEKTRFKNMLINQFNVPGEQIEIELSNINSLSDIKQQVIDRARDYVLGLVDKEVKV